MCTFGAEFVAMKTGIEALHGICYKFCMMDIPIDGATHIHEDSMSVIMIPQNWNLYLRIIITLFVITQYVNQ